MAAQKKQEAVVDEGAVYVLRPGIPVYLKTSDICAMTGKSNQWIGQLVSQGVLSKRETPRGAMFDLKETVRAYCDMLEARASEIKEPSAVEKDQMVAETTIKQARAVRFGLEARELQGKMHRSADVAHMTEDLIYTIRGMLLSLPGRLAKDTANTSDPAEVSSLIRQEIYDIMEELSRYKYDAKKYEERVRQRLNWDDLEHEEDADEDG